MRYLRETTIGPWQLGVRPPQDDCVVGSLDSSRELSAFLFSCSMNELAQLQLLLESTTSTSLLSREDLIDRLTAEVRRGRVWAYRKLVFRPLLDLTPRSSPLITEPHAAPRRAALAAPSCKPPPTRPWSGDAQAQAQTLERAANDGTAFCEICG